MLHPECHALEVCISEPASSSTSSFNINHLTLSELAALRDSDPFVRLLDYGGRVARIGDRFFFAVTTPTFYQCTTLVAWLFIERFDTAMAAVGLSVLPAGAPPP
jgi:hypothetical protein